MKRLYFKKLPILLQLSLLGILIVMIMDMLSIMAANYYRAIHVVKRNDSDYIKGVISQLNQSISPKSNDVKRIMEFREITCPIIAPIIISDGGSLCFNY